MLAKALEDAKATGAVLKVVEDPAEAAKDADVLATDTWTSMGEEAEKEVREKVFRGYQINRELLALADKEAIVLRAGRIRSRHFRRSGEPSPHAEGGHGSHYGLSGTKKRSGRSEKKPFPFFGEAAFCMEVIRWGRERGRHR